MKKRTWLILGAVVVFFGVVALAVYLAGGALETSLRFRVVDAVSGGWVWDATITLENREMREFYQSDHGAPDLEFTHLRPGNATLEVRAPAYAPQKVAVRLRRGVNTLPEPIRMKGLEIPTLDHFIVVDKRDQGQLFLEVRPVGTDGKAVLNHPCIDIWVGALISEQVKGGKYTEKAEDSGSERGRPLFAGKLAWTWDGTPETSFRYTVPVPLDKVQQSPAPYWVIDTLIAVPRPGAITPQELDQIMSKVFQYKDPREIAAYLDQYKDKFTYYLPPTAWNVKGGAS